MRSQCVILRQGTVLHYAINGASCICRYFHKVKCFSFVGTKDGAYIIPNKSTCS